MTFVDQPGPEGVGGEFRTPDEDVMRIMRTGRFQLSNRFRIECLLKLRFASGYSLQRPGVHDFVGRLPDLSEVAHERRLRAQIGISLPHHHGLIHSPSIEMSARCPHEVSDKSEIFLTWRCPVKLTILVLGVTIE